MIFLFKHVIGARRDAFKKSYAVHSDENSVHLKTFNLYDDGRIKKTSNDNNDDTSEQKRSNKSSIIPGFGQNEALDLHITQ